MQGYHGVTINPRHYQRDALRALWRMWGETNEATGQQYRKLLAVLPTGTGKTILFSVLCNHVVKNEGKNVLILAHRDELIRQAGDKLFRSTGIDYAVDKASETGHDTFHKVVVGSVQSLCNPKRMKRYRPNHFDYIIVDETHRILADTYQRILNYFSGAKVLGVTATAMRGDKQSLGKFFEEIAFEYRLRQAIDDGWLSPIVAETCPVTIDLRECRVNAGEFAASDVEEAIRPHLEAIADQIKLKASNRKTLVFLPLVATSKLMAQIMTEKGVPCKSVDGTMRDDDRRDTLTWYKNAPRGSALCNSMLLTEGFDQPDIDCIVVLRATKSRGLYCQMIGRGTRVLDDRINEEGLTPCQRKAIIAASDKKDMLILDFLWLMAAHRLCSPATLVATSEVAEEEIVKEQTKGGRKTLDELEEVGNSSVRVQREQALAGQLEALKGRKAVSINPVLHALSLMDDSILHWEPERQNELRPLTETQRMDLEHHGFTDTNDWSAGFAYKILGTIKERRDKGLATPRQLKMLIKYGIPNAEKVTFDGAKHIIDGLSKSWQKKGWKKR